MARPSSRARTYPSNCLRGQNGLVFSIPAQITCRSRKPTGCKIRSVLSTQGSGPFTMVVSACRIAPLVRRSPNEDPWMTGLTINTLQLHGLIDRMRAGDRTARDELLRVYYVRLEELARQSLQTFPRLRRRQDTGDILHPAL